jgi:hypothetical protein
MGKPTPGRFALDRRTLLRGAASGVTAALALPPLDAMYNGNGSALAAGVAIPKRLGVFFWGNGVRPNKWLPKTVGTAWEMTEELEPFANVRSHLSVVSGLDIKHRGAGHHVGRASMLTGAYDAAKGLYGQVDGPSIDQVAAKAWQGQTPFASLEIGISMTSKAGGRTRSGTAWSAPNISLPCEFVPKNLFMRLFGATAPDQEAREQAMRRGILDLVTKDATALRARLGAADKQRLDAHLDGIRAIERALNFRKSGCAAPPAPDVLVDTLSKEPLDERNKLLADILATALSCDLSRAFSYQYTGMQADTIFWQVGATEGDHVMTHDDRGLATVLAPQYENVHKVVVFIMKHFAYFLERLKGIPEGAGNLLDNCCIYATSEVNDGTAHSTSDMPVLIAGHAGGALKSGIHYRSTTKENATRALLTCMRAVGLAVDAFGTGVGRETASLSGLMA